MDKDQRLGMALFVMVVGWALFSIISTSIILSALVKALEVLGDGYSSIIEEDAALIWPPLAIIIFCFILWSWCPSSDEAGSAQDQG